MGKLSISLKMSSSSSLSLFSRSVLRRFGAHKGTVVSVRAQKGYGFIQMEGESEAIFYSNYDLKQTGVKTQAGNENFKQMPENREVTDVEFDIEVEAEGTPKAGKKRAVNVSLPGGAEIPLSDF